VAVCGERRTKQQLGGVAAAALITFWWRFSMIDLRLLLGGFALATLMVAVATLMLVGSAHNDAAKVRGINLPRIFDGKGTVILATLSLTLLGVCLAMLVWVLR
jgi:hypothetical protein